MKARRGSYRSGFVFGISSFAVVTTISIISSIATARIYGIRIIGEFALASAPVAALWVLSTAKEQAALVRELTQLPPRHQRVSQLFAAVFTFSSGLTAVMSCLAAVASWLIFTGPLHRPELVAPALVSLAGYAIVTNTGWNIDSIFAAFVAGRELFWVRLHEVLSFLLIAIMTGLIWRSIWCLVLATIGASLTALIHRIVAVHPFVAMRLTWREYRTGLQALPDLLRFGLKVTPGNIAQGLSQQAGIWAVGVVAPTALVGAYSRAQMIPERLQTVNMRIAEVLYPTLVSRREQQDPDGFDRALIDSVRYALFGMLLVAAVGGGAANHVLEVFGPGFSTAAPALALLLLFPALMSIIFAQNQALMAVSRPGATSVVQLGRLALTVGLTVVLAPKFAITGPAIALLAGLAFALGCNSLVLRPYLSRPARSTWPLRQQLALLGAYCAGFLAARQVEHALPSVAGLLASLAAGALSYILVLIAFGAINHRDRERRSDAVRMLRARLGGRVSTSPATGSQGGGV